MNDIKHVDKINKIENIEYEEFQDLLVSLLEKKGFKEIDIKADCIMATQDGLLGSTLSVFVTFRYKLGGVIDASIEDIANKITSIRDKYSANSVFIYSNKTISNGFSNTLNQKLTSFISVH